MKYMAIANKTITKTNIKAFEEAREAVIKLETLARFLSPADLETLEILLDKKTINILSRSLAEAEKEKFEPIEKIL
ncbi:hypothetical protein COY65_01945 [Candidatus Jorgensenbacteria bacterium CG_4_10_14_0_8_um_filter_39_13]|uniref:Uncharacterized protein n=2 Tax=Candidatus Joergenseniibacteriota TaxID=1752739 RepID=A0A2M7RHT8_9BACT|nr:MAG: hypothetical protein COV54_00975 [Candidatus Jorgensenbacteria bacterium CG11_big_fil_rev_8_21_14_0_20_38_23]PIV13091.1 MAG: hypothetical protein COS46_02145 [Candidatus Jorgensenbacteria bacterium CG03_land_8_20_14_0_80_38_39]PIW97916.1 MAG: hypothetical protein COZ81_00060 [Candidatus Jorgensenbacteria bacterium CG_4_8_14_3_um_filter_38_10]PIY95936.1 MAG: hypothetical protein COY65_01945 [Candidatus Jorgensenbacteria bacterium CG_4_10_14_0_8_um_filter_39_13]PJA94772.1 MAG: hypothetica